MSETYDDNVFATDDNTRDDLITMIPAARSASSPNFSRHRGRVHRRQRVGRLRQRDERGLSGIFVSRRRPARHHARQNFSTASCTCRARCTTRRDDPEDDATADEIEATVRYMATAPSSASPSCSTASISASPARSIADAYRQGAGTPTRTTGTGTTTACCAPAISSRRASTPSSRAATTSQKRDARGLRRHRARLPRAGAPASAPRSTSPTC